MVYFLNSLFLIIGIFLLIKGADLFVASSSSIAKKLKISPLIIGLTIVSFGTSAPELAVSVAGALSATGGTADIALGNVVGSNLMNLLVVLGLSAVIIPITVKKSITKKEFPFLILISVVLVFFSFDVLLNGATRNAILRGEALVLLCFLGVFLFSIIKGAKNESKEISEGEEIKEMKLKTSLILLVVGLAGIVVGAEFVTTPATTIATKVALAMKLDESLVTTLVGLTVVAIGTSLPELVTSVMAAKKGQNEIALGNVIGSNIFNILFILGVSGVITPLGMNGAVLFDMIVMVVATILVFIFCITGHKITRKEGSILLIFYLCYLIFIIARVFFPALNFFG